MAFWNCRWKIIVFLGWEAELQKGGKVGQEARSDVLFLLPSGMLETPWVATAWGDGVSFLNTELYPFSVSSLLLDVSTGAWAGSRVRESGTSTVASLFPRFPPTGDAMPAPQLPARQAGNRSFVRLEVCPGIPRHDQRATWLRLCKLMYGFSF